VARELRCLPSFIQQQPTGSWAAYIKNFTPTAIALKIPFGTMEALDKMDQADRLAVQDHMRSRYAALPAPPPTVMAQEPEASPKPDPHLPRAEKDKPRDAPPPHSPTAPGERW
jgi:hypothetical protein